MRMVACKGGRWFGGHPFFKILVMKKAYVLVSLFLWVLVAIIIIVALSILVSCSPSRILPDQQLQASLLSYKKTSGHSAHITAITPAADTCHLLYTWSGMGIMKFYRNQKFTTKYNSAHYTIIDGRRYYPAMITSNN